MENRNIELNLKIEKRDVHKVETQNIMLDTSQISTFSNKQSAFETSLRQKMRTAPDPTLDIVDIESEDYTNNRLGFNK